MQNNPWKKERLYGLLAVVFAIATSLITGFWAWSFLLWAMMYILWKWVELFYFYQWFKNGADTHNLPLNSGIWKEFCNIVIHNKKNHAKIEKKNKYLLYQFNITAQALPYATVILNKKFEIIWANQASQQIIGVMEKQHIGVKIDDIIIDPVFLTLLTAEEKSQEIKISHPHDNLKKIHIKLVKLSNKRYLLVARDISEQESLRKSRKAFVANASHELRTPLTVITGYLEMLYASDEVPEQWQHAILQAMQQSDRMGNIINDMLKLSSIEHERFLESKDELINMPVLLNNLLNDVKNSSKAKQHIFVANIDSELCINGNEKDIVSVCLNLLNNAVVHTKPNTEISLRWFKQNQKAHLWICDNGDGIEQKHLHHLTERFYRVDNSRDKNTGSTGLGLAIVKQICDNHDAILQIESELKKGSCFKVEFSSSRIAKSNRVN